MRSLLKMRPPPSGKTLVIVFTEFTRTLVGIQTGDRHLNATSYGDLTQRSTCKSFWIAVMHGTSRPNYRHQARCKLETCIANARTKYVLITFPLIAPASFLSWTQGRATTPGWPVMISSIRRAYALWKPYLLHPFGCLLTSMATRQSTHHAFSSTVVTWAFRSSLFLPLPLEERIRVETLCSSLNLHSASCARQITTCSTDCIESSAHSQ